MFPLSILQKKAIQDVSPLTDDLVSYIEQIHNREAAHCHIKELCNNLEKNIEIRHDYEDEPYLQGEWQYGLEGMDGTRQFLFYKQCIGMFCRMAMEALLPKAWQHHIFFKEGEIGHVDDIFYEYDLETSAMSRENLDILQYNFKWSNHVIPALALEAPVNRIADLRNFLHYRKQPFCPQPLSPELIFRRCFKCNERKSYCEYKPERKHGWRSHQPICLKCLDNISIENNIVNFSYRIYLKQRMTVVEGDNKYKLVQIAAEWKDISDNEKQKYKDQAIKLMRSKCRVRA